MQMIVEVIIEVQLDAIRVQVREIQVKGSDVSHAIIFAIWQGHAQ
jgi:hypothetical protein